MSDRNEMRRMCADLGRAAVPDMLRVLEREAVDPLAAPRDRRRAIQSLEARAGAIGAMAADPTVSASDRAYFGALATRLRARAFEPAALKRRRVSN